MSHWSDPNAAPGHFRIRMGNEEVALGVGVTLIGRDASCRIKLLDALTSRRHARIQCDGEQAAIEDLDSRNGTRVNGVLISGPHALREGDRIGIGAYELVVSRIDPALESVDPPTGLLSICADCQFAHPKTVSLLCPRCGSTRDVSAARPQRTEATGSRWSLGMLLEMLGRSMLTERVEEADKLMRQVSILLSDQLKAGVRIDRDELHALGEAVAWLTKAQHDPAWSDWLERVHSLQGDTMHAPPRAVDK